LYRRQRRLTVIDTVGAAVFKESIASDRPFCRLNNLAGSGRVEPEPKAQNAKFIDRLELMLIRCSRDLPEAREKHVEILNQCAQWADEGLLKPHYQQAVVPEKILLSHKLIEAVIRSEKLF